jgi:hypothetical protein
MKSLKSLKKTVSPVHGSSAAPRKSSTDWSCRTTPPQAGLVFPSLKAQILRRFAPQNDNLALQYLEHPAIASRHFGTRPAIIDSLRISGKGSLLGKYSIEVDKS